MRSCHAWFDSICLQPGLLSITHRISMQCCWLPAWLIVPESIDWTTLAVHWADETLRIPGVVICVDNSITFKCFENFPCGKLVLHRTLCEELFRVLEKCFVFCFLCFTKSVLNWFYISYQHAVTSWFADIKQALGASKIMEFRWVQNESSSTFSAFSSFMSFWYHFSDVEKL